MIFGALVLCASLPTRAWAFDEAALCVVQDEFLESSQLEPELQCANGGLEHLPGPQWTAPISITEARTALGKAQQLMAAGKLDDALIELRLVEHAMPRVRDRIALRRAGLLMSMNRPADACEAYAIAQASPDRNVAAEARIAMVRCMLEAGQRDGEAELTRIMNRYPHMGGERAELRLELGRARQAWGNLAGAVAIFRSIDLDEPHSAVASDARAALAAIAATGFVVRPLTAAERVDRAERLVMRGTVESGHEAVKELLEGPALTAAQAGRAHLLAARIARVEGRWDDVRSEVAQAMKLGVPAPEAQRFLPRSAAVSAEVDPTLARSEGEAQLKRMLGGKALPKLRTDQLRAVLDVAVRYRLSEPATDMIQVLSTRTNVHPAMRFEAAMLAFGLASDTTVAALLETVLSVPTYALSARYHHARALERLGRFAEAEADYQRVLRDDKRDPRYYAMWADLRLWAMHSEAAQTCVPEGSALAARPALPVVATPAAPVAPRIDTNLAAAIGADEEEAAEETDVERDADAAVASLDEREPSSEQPAVAPIPDVDPAVIAKRERLLAELTTVAQAHGDAYPWLPRAADLISLDLFEDAADEVGEAYLAWRDARGELRLRSGLEAVLTGEAPARHIADFALRKARLSLDKSARTKLAAVADELGDPGVSLRFRDVRGEMRPRAYAADVEAAAKKYRIDPNLLFAVMRVESIYHRQIVSYAGAVGLMQIMPRTGALIARELGVERFDVTDLLDPRTNVEFAAWYLSSLIERFDGRLPLAIAAYNGGPHNVRLWMQEGHPDMPLDAFLERIPFDQTHRYVRRVLTHYAAYRAQQHLPMTRLDVALPTARPDAMAF